MAQPMPILVLACGALAREIQHLKKTRGWSHLRVSCLDPMLHNQPQRIAPQLRAAIRRFRLQYDRIFVAYADCGSQGEIDEVCAEFGCERLPGAHCYQFFAGQTAFAAMADDEPGTFYLTDFLCRHFDRMVVESLKLDRHPELIPTFFGNYRRLTYLAQLPDDDLRARARAAARFLGLEYREVETGFGGLETAMANAMDDSDGEKDPRLLA